MPLQPILWYEMEQLDGPVVDTVGVFDGIAVGGVVRGVAGAPGHGLGFELDGDTGRIEVDAFPKAAPAEVTIMAWVQTTDPTFDVGPYNNATLMSLHYGWGLDYNVGLLSVSHNSGGNFPQSALAPATIADGTWHHLAATLGGGLARLYVDGTMIDEEIVTNVGHLAGDEQWATFGAFRTYGTTAGHLLGTIDEVKVFDLALDEDEIACAAAS